MVIRRKTKMVNFLINTCLWTLALYGLFELVKQIINMITYTKLRPDGIYIIIAVNTECTYLINVSLLLSL